MISDTSGQDRRLAKTQGFGYKTIVIVAVLVILIGLGVQAVSRIHRADMTVSRERLQFAKVSVSTVERDLVVQGRIVAANSPTLYATTQGVITFLVKAGDKVSSGSVLAELDSPSLSNLFQQEQSQLSRLDVALARQKIQVRRQLMQNSQAIELQQVNLDAAIREMQRAEKSIETNIISRLDYAKVGDDLERAKLELLQEKQNTVMQAELLNFEVRTRLLELEQQQLVVDDLQRQVNALSILSPVNGLVGSLARGQKAAVVSNDALLTVVDLSSFEI
ncbi:MAG: efflux transporter periplasmic adaptor subunit, partial [Spongiibacteraceae bacterium]|nr:efflux transporter periplasmic adaptor subunit [Spongiibacteraceae bacterium]